MDTKERKKLHRWEQKNRWMTHYEIKYGVFPIEYGPPVAIGSTGGGGSAAYTIDTTPTVLKAKCRFCECYGREAIASDLMSGKAVAAAAAAAAGIEFPGSPMGSSGEGVGGMDENSSNGGDHPGSGSHLHGQPPLKRRKKRQTLKVFGPNFRTDNLESHLTREHPVKWKEYERLRDVEKKSFFPEGVVDSKELLLAQQVAAAANVAAAMSLSMRHTPLAAPTSASSTAIHGGAKPGAAGSNVSYHVLEKTTMPTVKQMVTTEIMMMIESLLASPVLRQQQASLYHDSSSALGSFIWQTFVREDDQLTETAAATAATTTNDASGGVDGCSVTGECKALGNDFCTVSLKNEALFQYIIDVFSAKASLDATLALVHATQRLVPDAAGILNGVTLADISSSVHQLMALNLSCISQLMSFAWGYSLVLRFVTYHGTGFLDLRVQVAVNDETHDLHLLAIPLDASKHSVDTLGSVIMKALTVLDARALEKIVGLTIDGDHYHMHKYKEIGSWLKHHAEEATSQAACYVLYGGVYHVSFIVDELLDHCQADQDFLTSLAELEAICRGHASLRSTMGPEPPRFASARWISIFNSCEWLTVHRETILKWASDHPQVYAKLPPTQWWVTLFVLRDVLKDVYAVFKKCRESSNSFADVQKHLRDLVFQLRLKFNIKTNEAAGTGAGTTAGAGQGATAGVGVGVGVGDTVPSSAGGPTQLDPCEFSYQDFVNFVIPLDLFMYEAFQLKSIDGLTDDDRLALYQRFQLVLMLLINKVLAVINSSPDSPVPPPPPPAAATDPNSAGAAGPNTTTTGASTSSSSQHQYAMQIPPSTPYEFITINNLSFMDLLNQQRFRIRSKGTGKVLSMITEDRNRMMAEVTQPGALGLYGAKLHQSGGSNFRDAWKPFLVEFPSLASFASVFGGLLHVTRTTEDELEHFYHNMNRYAASNLALEAQLHGAQYHKVSILRRHGDATVV